MKVPAFLCTGGCVTLLFFMQQNRILVNKTDDGNTNERAVTYLEGKRREREEGKGIVFNCFVRLGGPNNPLLY